MASFSERRGGKRVKFDHGVERRIMAIDATWQRACTMRDASNSGAKLTISGSLQGLALKEFFLVLSPTVTGVSPLRACVAQRRGDRGQVSATGSEKPVRQEQSRVAGRTKVGDGSLIWINPQQNIAAYWQLMSRLA
jgi:hypothetical protein